MKILRLAAIACAVLVAPSVARAGDPTGAWKWTVKTPTGDSVDVSLTLELKDGKLTGSYSSRLGPAPITDASFKDETVAFSVVREFDGNKFTLKYSGTLVGDTIKGSIDFPGLGGSDPAKMDWNATRVK